jgi:hypothetical protein
MCFVKSQYDFNKIYKNFITTVKLDFLAFFKYSERMSSLKHKLSLGKPVY